MVQRQQGKVAGKQNCQESLKKINKGEKVLDEMALIELHEEQRLFLFVLLPLAREILRSFFPLFSWNMTLAIFKAEKRKTRI